MKKIIFVFVLSILPFAIFAQGLISFGPKIGWNSERLTTDYTQYVRDIKSGFQGGVFFSLYLNKLYIQPEAYFSIKRGALQATINPLDPQSKLEVRQSVKLQSVDIPLLLGFKVIDLKLIRFRIWGGPVVSYLINKEYTLSNTNNGNDLSNRITRDDFKNATWSGQVGAGLDVLMLTFDIGYEFGLNSFLTIQSLDDFNLRNNLFYCSIGWRIF
jgi:hypothetical protein